jgi:cytidylate kinase
MSTTSNQVVEALARLQNYAKSEPRTEQTPPPITVAISRQAGARGAEIGRAVGALLGWPVYDRELLTCIADDKGLHARLLEHLDEHHTSWLGEILGSLAAQPALPEAMYVKHLLELLAALGKAGHCVIVGRGAAQVLPMATTLRVRIVAPRALRLAETEKRWPMSKTDAERWVDTTDGERERFVKHLFSKRAGWPDDYDLILNSGRYGTVACAALIVKATRLMEDQVDLLPHSASDLQMENVSGLSRRSHA